jgi:hypothetical protein
LSRRRQAEHSQGIGRLGTPLLGSGRACLGVGLGIAGLASCRRGSRGEDILCKGFVF